MIPQGPVMAIRTLYDWTLRKAATPAAELWLAVTAFIESSVFLIPADVLFVPMALAKPMRAYRYALTATLASTLGGLAVTCSGTTRIKRSQCHEQLQSSTSKDAILLMLMTSGLAHMP